MTILNEESRPFSSSATPALRVTDLRCIPLYGTPDGGSWQDRLGGGSEQVNVLVEVCTDGGVTGIGSAFTSGPLVEAACALLRPLLIGESAVDPLAVSEALHQKTFWQGRGGAVTHAISAIDIALWDIMGKVTGQPISRLLGGRFRERIKPYGSMHMLADHGLIRDRLQGGLGRGFRAFKLGWGPFGRTGSATDDEAIIRLAREAVGNDVELMVDAGGSEEFWPHGYKWALRTAEMLADYGIVWFEEPLRPDDIDGYALLTEHAPLPIACGEVLTRRQSFLPWIERRAVDFLQPDVTKVGGISEQHYVGRLAHEHGVMVVPHGWNTAVGLAADLQLVAAALNARWVEYMAPNEYIDAMLLDPIEFDRDGHIAIPSGPGLGFEWDPDGIARLAGGVTITPTTG